MAQEEAKILHQKILGFRNRDPVIRKECANYIPQICAALGQERTNDEFIPYLTATTGNTEDQWATIVSNLGKINFADYGNNELTAFLDRIRIISEMDSRRIREAFTECVCQMEVSVAETVFGQVVPSFVQSMIMDTWGPVQATGFALLTKMPALAQKLTDDEISEIFKVECTNNTVTKALIVAACAVIDDSSSDVAALLWQIVKELTNNDSRMVVSEIPRFLVKYVGKTNDLANVLDVAVRLMKHDNWMIRCSVLMTFSELFANDRIPGDKIIELLLTALSDPVDEVHTAVAEQLPFVATTTITNTENLKNLLQNLAKAPNANSRTSLANHVTLFYEMVPIEVITVILIDLIGDTSRQVKIAAIKALSMPQIPREVTIECVEKLAETTAEWRERRDIASVMPLILTDEIDGAEFKKLVGMLMMDPAFETRETMIRNLPQLITKFGGNWKQEVVIPILCEAIKDDDYNMRQMVVKTIAELGDWSEQELDLVRIASDDVVSNVRLVVAKFIPRSQTVILDKLKEDEDEDVRELANKV